MITKVKVENWRSHLDSTVDFTGGTNILTGSMGAGKSSIMDAITFGLFGTFPNLQAKKLKLDDLIMNRPSEQDEARVVVNFGLNGREYSVMRVIGRGKGTTYSEIREGDKLLDAPNSQRVTEVIQKLLRIDYELFSKAIYSEQNGIDYFLRLSRGERMRRIDNLLMIDRFEKARSSAVTLTNKLIERKLGKQSIVEQVNVKELENTLGSVEKELKDLRENQKRFYSEHEILEKKAKEIERILIGLEDSEKRLNALERQRKSLDTSIEENRNTINKINALLKGKNPEEIKTRFDELISVLETQEKYLEKMIQERETLSSTTSRFIEKIRHFERDIKNKKKSVQEKQQMREKIQKLKKEFGDDPEKIFKDKKGILRKIDHDIVRMQLRLKELETIVDQTIELKDKCPICNSRISTEKKKHLIEEKEREEFKIKKELKERESTRQKLEIETNTLERVVEEFKTLLREIIDLNDLEKELKELEESYSQAAKELREFEEKLTKTRGDISKLQDKINNTKSEVKQLEIGVSRISELEDRQSRLKDLEFRVSEVEKKIRDVSKKLERGNINATRKEYQRLIVKKSELKTRIESQEDVAREKEKRRKEIEEKLDLIKKQSVEILKLEKLIKDLKVFEKALEQTQIQLREEFITAVNHTMNNIWPNLYPYTDFSSIRLSIQQGDYVLQLKDRTDRWVNVEGIASGGERSIASLALRIAFSLVLAPQLKWLILDEPTHNLDTRAVEGLAETLRSRIGDIVQQTFIITHDKILENAGTGELYRLHRDKEVDGITHVERVSEL